MEFSEYITEWVNQEILQARIMIGLGLIVLLAVWRIVVGDNDLLRGALLPLGLLLVLLLGYGGYILYSRPAHAEQSIALYDKSVSEAITRESAKHTNDNKMGETLLKIYPILMLISVIALMLFTMPFYKGMAAGFLLLFLSIYVIDTGFVTRSNAFLTYLQAQK